MEIILVGSLQKNRDSQLLCFPFHFLKQEFFTEIASVHRIVPYPGLLQFINWQHDMHGTHFTCHSFCHLHIPGRVQPGMNGCGIDRFSCFFGTVTGRLQQKAAVHTARKRHHEIRLCQLIHKGAEFFFFFHCLFHIQPHFSMLPCVLTVCAVYAQTSLEGSLISSVSCILPV